MRITLLIYAISWSIVLLILFIIPLIKKKKISSESFGVYLLIIISAPVIVLWFLYDTISKLITAPRRRREQEERAKMREEIARKRARKWVEEAARKKAEEEKNRLRKELPAREFYNKMSKAVENQYTESLQTLACNLHKFIKSNKDVYFSSMISENFPDPLKALNRIVQVKDAKLEIRGSVLFINTPSGRIEYHQLCGEKSPFLKVDISGKGAWQVYLLNTIPFFIHELYGKRYYIFKEDDIYSFKAGGNFASESEREKNTSEMELLLKKGVDILPKIYVFDDMFYVSCCYWNDWEGLVREYVKISHSEGWITSIDCTHYDVLYEYDCGVTYNISRDYDPSQPF